MVQTHPPTFEHPPNHPPRGVTQGLSEAMSPTPAPWAVHTPGTGQKRGLFSGPPALLRRHRRQEGGEHLPALAVIRVRGGAGREVLLGSGHCPPGPGSVPTAAVAQTKCLIWEFRWQFGCGLTNGWLADWTAQHHLTSAPNLETRNLENTTQKYAAWPMILPK